MIPVDMKALCESQLEPEMRPMVENMMLEKRSGRGDDVCRPIPALDNWILRVRHEIESDLQLMRAPKSVSWRTLDSIFLKMLEANES